MSDLENMEYTFKYDDVIKQTKRELRKQRKAVREAKKGILESPAEE